MNFLLKKSEAIGRGSFKLKCKSNLQKNFKGPFCDPVMLFLSWHNTIHNTSLFLKLWVSSDIALVNYAYFTVSCCYIGIYVEIYGNKHKSTNWWLFHQTNEYFPHVLKGFYCTGGKVPTFMEKNEDEQEKKILLSQFENTLSQNHNIQA